MAVQCMGFAKLDPKQLAKVFELENELGCSLIAVQSRFSWGKLDQEELHDMQASEDSSGYILLSYSDKTPKPEKLQGHI